MKKLTTIVAAIALTMSLSATAEETGAGCGLGAEIMKGQSTKGSNIAAALLNNLVIPNTFFMTTGGGIMGCDPTKTVEGEQARKTFVASNFDKITSDAATGKGDHLVALGYLMGVSNDDIPAFEKMTQSQFDTLFVSNDNAESLLTSLNTAMRDNDVLSKYATQ